MPFHRTAALTDLCVFLAACGLLAACSTSRFREAADREVYALIAEKTPDVVGMPDDFTIEQAELPSMDDLSIAEVAPEFLGEEGLSEVGARVVSLERALDLAVKNNRTYQNEKESLYLQALSLTLDRYSYTPIFSGGGGASYNKSTRDVVESTPIAQAASSAPDLVAAIGGLTGTPGDLIDGYAALVGAALAVPGVDTQRTRIVDERSVSGDSRLGVDLLLKGGGRIAVDLTSDFLRFITGDPRVTTSSALVSTITQPLLRGAGRKAAAERLTQAERDLLYALRAFTRFRQTFTVDVCSSYYEVLQNRDAVRNNWRSFQSFRLNAERERAFAEENLRTVAELGRLEQALLRTEGSWITSVRRYKQSLDLFKIQLGLPTNAPIVLDDGELTELKAKGILHPDIMADDAVKVALVARPDLYTDRDQAEDAKRRVYVAANALKPGLDLSVSANVPSMPGDRFQELDFERMRWGAGLDVDLPLNRKSERNSYRAALIAMERARRNLTLAEDRVKLDVRDGWRALDSAKRTYEISLKGVELNERRVEEQLLRADLGIARAQDQVDAQNDLNEAENAWTAALVTHTIARLEFWRDMGILFIKENGQWEEVTDVRP
ncbi:MAG: TolC family protein [Nitrospiraceae bacterium]|nr:TolC family protein [Nitrospiraceae bacterium]